MADWFVEEAAMEEARDLNEVARRPYRYWNIDGLPECTMGGVWILWGAAMIIGNSLPKGSLSTGYWMAVPLLLVASGLAMNRVTHWLKARITFPRTGYVRMLEPSRAVRFVSHAIAALSAGALSALVVTGRASQWESVVPAGTAIVIAVALATAAVRSRAPHLLWLSGFSLVLAGWLYVDRGGYSDLNLLLVWLGVASVVLGGIRLRRFLRRYPIPAGPGE
jgi:hypothetical protein